MLFTLVIGQALSTKLDSSQAFDPSNLGVRSDVHIGYKGVYLYLCEVKKPGVDLRFDFERLTLDLKDAVDDAVSRRINSKAVTRCLVRGKSSKCALLSAPFLMINTDICFDIITLDDKGDACKLELVAESAYMMRSIESFVRSKDNSNMTMALLTNLPLFLWLAVSVRCLHMTNCKSLQCVLTE